MKKAHIFTKKKLENLSGMTHSGPYWLVRKPCRPFWRTPPHWGHDLSSGKNQYWTLPGHILAFFSQPWATTICPSVQPHLTLPPQGKITGVPRREAEGGIPSLPKIFSNAAFIKILGNSLWQLAFFLTLSLRQLALTACFFKKGVGWRVKDVYECDTGWIWL